MASPWIVEEMRTADLGDKRLNERLHATLEQLSARPTASIPAACGGYAEMMAAYRFMNNPKATVEQVLAPHAHATHARLASQARVVVVADTTEIDLTRPGSRVAGAGPLDTGARRGLFMHLVHAFTPDGTPLGTLEAFTYTREEPSTPALSQKERAAQRKKTPIEAKESRRWLESFRRARTEAEALPGVEVNYVVDSESDIYEFLEEAAQARDTLRWMVRAGQNRALQPDPGETPADAGETAADAVTRLLRDQLLQQPVRCSYSVKLRARTAKVKVPVKGRGTTRTARTAHVEVRAARVTLRPPARPDRTLAPVEVNAVVVYEPAPPAGEERVEWLLLTNRPIDTPEAVCAVVELYAVRWMIEVFFRTLKTGCRVEARRFETVEGMATCLALYLMVAWRTLYVCRMGRDCPEVPCEVIFAPEEWKPVYRVVHKTAPPATPPTLQEMVQMVAQLGGYIPRKNSPPGPQTVWLGLQRMHDLSLGWLSFGPEANVDPQDV